MTGKHDGSAKPEHEDDTVDVGSLFRGTATITFVVEVVACIMMLGSLAAYIINMSGLIQIVTVQTAALLLMIGGIVTLGFFLITIGFFVRVNRRISRAAIWEGAGKIDLSTRGAKSVLAIYILAVGLVLLLGMYIFYLAYETYLAPIALTSLSIFGFSISFSIFLLALLIQVIVIAVGRTAGPIVRKVLAEDSNR